VYQGYGTNKQVYRGTIYIIWKAAKQGDCCNHWIYTADFDLTGKICLDSNRWPIYTGPAMFGTLIINEKYAGSPFIPGKKVTFKGESEWAGCCEPDQRFTILSARDKPRIPFP
jgi:hypothetical protein